MGQPIATRVFTEEDQERFARLTGDRNPMHMDVTAARRTQAGGRAVHGVHAALWALDQLAAAGEPLGEMLSLKVDFTRFLHLDRIVTLDVLDRTSDSLRAGVHVAGAPAVVLTLGFGASRAGGVASPAEPRRPLVPIPEAPDEPDFPGMGTASGLLRPAEGALERSAEMFPAACGALGAARITAIGLLSTLVGMVVPGRHSIFAGFVIRMADQAPEPAGLEFAARGADERFRLVTLAVAGPGFAGTASAFARFPPVGAPTLARISGRVRPDAFAGRRALVIGGSRGIGAVTAKLLAAGGAIVTLTYVNSRADAEAIRDEIGATFGPDRAAILRYDATEAPAAQLSRLAGPFTHVYYFATGRIFEPSDRVYDPARLRAFLEVYVEGFAGLVEHLLAAAPGQKLSVLYPSSVFVDTRPAQMTEYAMAKAAGEVLCVDLARARRGLTITAPRLPRVLTDQTATVPPVQTADALEVMLPLLLAESA